MAYQNVVCTILVMDSKLVHHGGTRLVQANHFDLRTLSTELQHHFVEGTDGSDVPKVCTADRLTSMRT